MKNNITRYFTARMYCVSLRVDDDDDVDVVDDPRAVAAVGVRR